MSWHTAPIVRMGIRTAKEQKGVMTGEEARYLSFGNSQSQTLKFRGKWK